ncbi:MAG TPA: tetratricopeptide repeat protein [candidate division Zixibacteria bacterium]|nr:tetratricopeptide repeat protein [candidate division Zixibacteria bacterium]
MHNRLILAVVLMAILASGCTPSFYAQGRKHIEQGRYDDAIDALYAEIASHPQRADAWRELGVAFYEKGNFEKAQDALQQAAAISPDARTQLFMGLIAEKQGQFDGAIRAYTGALALQSKGSTARQVRAHLDQLVARQIEREASEAIAAEAEINVDTIPRQTIAVANFDGSYLPPELAPIARGLAEFTAIDLAKVNQLTVLDRMKLDMILKELQLGQSGVVDPTTAPRVGRLMGTARIVTGSALSVGDDGLKLDGAIVSTIDSTSTRTAGIEGNLEQFFDLEKKFVFSIIDNLGITLTPEERDAISEVPTEDYLAFLAYCRGLDYESRGMRQAAQQEFQQAKEIDNNFDLAEFELNSVTLGGTSYGESFVQLENTVLGDLTTGVTSPGLTLDSRLSNIVINSGNLPFNLPSGSSTVLQPPYTMTVRIYIRGNLDAM